MGKIGFNLKCKVPKFLKSVRYTLAAVNGIFLLTGLVILIVGITILVLNSKYDELITQRFYNVPGFTIATGVIILLGAVLGFYGSISENFYFIAGYVVVLLMVLVFEISIIIAGFTLSADAASVIRPTMAESINQYRTRIDIAMVWDNLQMDFQCCGVSGWADYASHLIPVSCCHMDFGTVSPFECGSSNAYKTGCAALLGEWLSYNAHVIAMTAVVLTCLQVLLAAVAGWLAWRSRFEEVELES